MVENNNSRDLKSWLSLLSPIVCTVKGNFIMCFGTWCVSFPRIGESKIASSVLASIHCWIDKSFLCKILPFYTKYNFCFKNTIFYSLEYYFLWANVGTSLHRMRQRMLDPLPFQPPWRVLLKVHHGWRAVLEILDETLLTLYSFLNRLHVHVPSLKV